MLFVHRFFSLVLFIFSLTHSSLFSPCTLVGHRYLAPYHCSVLFSATSLLQIIVSFGVSRRRSASATVTQGEEPHDLISCYVECRRGSCLCETRIVEHMSSLLTRRTSLTKLRWQQANETLHSILIRSTIYYMRNSELQSCHTDLWFVIMSAPILFHAIQIWSKLGKEIRISAHRCSCLIVYFFFFF